MTFDIDTHGAVVHTPTAFHGHESSHDNHTDAMFPSTASSDGNTRVDENGTRESGSGTTGSRSDTVRSDSGNDGSTGTRHDSDRSTSGSGDSFASKPNSAFWGQPAYGQPGYGQQQTSGGILGNSSSGGGLFGSRPMGPTIFLVPTRGMGSCSGNSAPNMVQLPSMYSTGPLLLNAMEVIRRQSIRDFF